MKLTPGHGGDITRLVGWQTTPAASYPDPDHASSNHSRRHTDVVRGFVVVVRDVVEREKKRRKTFARATCLSRIADEAFIVVKSFVAIVTSLATSVTSLVATLMSLLAYSLYLSSRLFLKLFS